MARTKVKPVCITCGTNENLYITLGNGEKLPSYTIAIGRGIVCNDCKALEKEGENKG